MQEKIQETIDFICSETGVSIEDYESFFDQHYKDIVECIKEYRGSRAFDMIATLAENGNKRAAAWYCILRCIKFSEKGDAFDPKISSYMADSEIAKWYKTIKFEEGWLRDEFSFYCDFFDLARRVKRELATVKELKDFFHDFTEYTWALYSNIKNIFAVDLDNDAAHELIENVECVLQAATQTGNTKVAAVYCALCTDCPLNHDIAVQYMKSHDIAEEYQRLLNSMEKDDLILDLFEKEGIFLDFEKLRHDYDQTDF